MVQRRDFILTVDDIQRFTDQNRYKYTGNGGIKTDGGVHRDAVTGGVRVGLQAPVQVVHQAAMFDHDTFGSTGGAGGVDDVGQMTRCQAEGRRCDIVSRAGGPRLGVTFPFDLTVQFDNRQLSGGLRDECSAYRAGGNQRHPRTVGQHVA